MTVCYDPKAKHPGFYKEPAEALAASIWIRNSRCEADYPDATKEAKDHIRQLKKYGFKIVRVRKPR